jgi:hypothetical protein
VSTTWTDSTTSARELLEAARGGDEDASAVARATGVRGNRCGTPRRFAGMLGRSTILAALALAVIPVQAIATPQDIAATHAYIQANYALARASVATIGPAQAKIERLNRKLRGECPHAGAGALQNEASQPMSYEVAVALWSVAYGAAAGPIRTFVGVVRKLRWSDHRITHTAQNYASSLSELATLPLPDLCAEVRAWKASGFQMIPATTARLVRRVEAIEPQTIPPRLLAPYERGADRAILARTTRLETKLTATEFTLGFNDWDLLLETLGLNQ